jgi:hypothetical protein
MKKQIINTVNNLDESPEYFAEWKEPNPKCYNIFLHLHSTLEMAKL